MNNLTLAEIERAVILSAWQRSGYDVLATARALDVGKTTIYRKLHGYGVGKPLIVQKIMCEEASRQLNELRAQLCEVTA